MAWTALFTTELLALSRSWVLRGWLIALGLAEFFMLTRALLRAPGSAVPASTVLATTLDAFLLVWSIVIIVLGAGSVSLESDVISDSILSRPCTRTQFISAKFASRVLVVVSIYLVCSLVAGFAAWRYGANDMTPETIAVGVGTVGLAVVLLLSLGIMFSVIFNNTVMAVASMLLLWYVASPVFSFLGADYLSPTSLVSNLPRMLKDPDQPQLVDCSASQSSITLTFSKALDPQTAEQPANYVIEDPDGTRYPAATAVYDKQKLNVVLSGLTLPEGAKLKVTAQNVTDVGGSGLSPAASSANDVMVPAAEPAAPMPGTQEAKPAPAVPRSGVSREGAPPRVVSCTATASSVKVTFSTDMIAKEVENVQNYIVESPQGRTHQARAATYSNAAHTVLLTGLTFAQDEPVKVTVKGVHSAAGTAIGSRGNSATYTELTTWKYVLGLGLPSLFAFFISVAWFAGRDL
jgi:ABC-type transport system involved in multi-copper enzyme maturation permease subunit